MSCDERSFGMMAKVQVTECLVYIHQCLDLCKYSLLENMSIPSYTEVHS